MKFLLTKLFFIACILSASATVRTVDNNASAPSGTLVYSTFTAAITAAANNDTLLVIPSGTSYGTVNITKPLTIIGVGFNPDSETKLTCKLGQTYIYNAAAGTKLIGLVLESYLYLGNTSGSLTNILIENCQLNYGIQNSGITQLSNVIIRQCYFQISNNTYSLYLTSSNSNVFISNCVFNYQVANYRYYGISAPNGGLIIDHCLFYGVNSTGNNAAAFYNLSNSTISNCVFQGRRPISYSSFPFKNVTFKNNLSKDMDIKSATVTGTNLVFSGNLSQADPLFTNLPVRTSGTAVFDNSVDATLQTGSPAKNAGTDGADLGVYGGITPYKNTGSVLPVVKKFALPNSIKEGQNATADIEVTGN